MSKSFSTAANCSLKSAKHQDPSSNEAPNFKHQMAPGWNSCPKAPIILAADESSRRIFWRLNIGVSRSLVLGTWNFQSVGYAAEG
jgi:hypothetical protein